MGNAVRQHLTSPHGTTEGRCGILRGVPLFFWGKATMSLEYKCLNCGKWFDPQTVDHTNEFWKGYRHRDYCSVECAGHAEAEYRMSYADHIRHDNWDEENGPYES